MLKLVIKKLEKEGGGGEFKEELDIGGIVTCITSLPLGGGKQWKTMKF